MESAYNHSSWTASFWQQMYYFNNLLQHTWTINPTTVNTISVFMNQMSAHSAAQELGSDGKADVLLQQQRGFQFWGNWGQRACGQLLHGRAPHQLELRL